MALADDVQRLLYILKYDFARLLESSHLHLDYLPNRFFVLFDILYALIIFYHTRYPKVKAAEYNPLLYILDEC